MSATNHTPNYSLPQFIGTDVPTWLVDVNGAFSDIDTAIKNAADAAGVVAGDVTSLGNRVTTVEGGLATTNGNLGALQNTVSGQTTTIAANSTKIGSSALDTTAQNLSGAVNELHSELHATDAIASFSVQSGWHLLADEASMLVEVGDLVSLNLDIVPDDGILRTGRNVCGTLPAGYRPAAEVAYPCMVFGSGIQPKAYTLAFVKPNGEVEIYQYGGNNAGVVRALFTATFVASN